MTFDTKYEERERWWRLPAFCVSLLYEYPVKNSAKNLWLSLNVPSLLFFLLFMVLSKFFFKLKWLPCQSPWQLCVATWLLGPKGCEEVIWQCLDHIFRRELFALYFPSFSLRPKCSPSCISSKHSGTMALGTVEQTVRMHGHPWVTLSLDHYMREKYPSVWFIPLMWVPS